MASIWIGKLEFEWDDEKAASNWRKHGVSFEEAATVFEDIHGLYQADSGADEDEGERRFFLLGVSHRQRMMVVIHVERGVLRMRIISARLPTKEERRLYEGRDH